MGHSTRLRFTLLHLANLHFSFQCINVNSPEFKNISVINISVTIIYISMYQTKNVAILI